MANTTTRTGTDNLKVEGIKQIQHMFNQLPKQIDNDKIWIRFWREVSKPLVKQAKANASQYNWSNKIKNSIGFFTTKASRRANGGYVGLRTRGAFRKEKSGFYGAFVEYGSEVKFYGKGYGKDQPFLNPAWDSSKPVIIQDGIRKAEIVFDRAIKSHVKRLNKYGRLGY